MIINRGASSVLLRCCLIFVTLLIVAGFTVLGKISAQNDGWFSGNPTLTKITDLDGLPDASKIQCTPTKVPIFRGMESQLEDHCLINTQTGFLETSSQVWQPAGYDSGYPIQNHTGTGSVILSLPSSKQALSAVGTGFGDVTIGVYDDFAKNLTFDIDINGVYQRSKVMDLFNQPNWSLHYPNGAPMRFTLDSVSSSNNGRFVAIDSYFSGVMLVNMETKEMKPVATSGWRSGDNSMRFSPLTAVSDDGTVTAEYMNPANGWGVEPYLKITDTASCNDPIPQDTSSAPNITCRTKDIYSSIQKAIPGLQYIIKANFSNDHILSFVAAVDNGSGRSSYHVYKMVASGSSNSTVQYEALGDSYISGEGAYSYRKGTDTPRNMCHQSTKSYPYLLGVNFSSFASVACSGATIQNVVNQHGSDSSQLHGGNPNNTEILAAETSHLPGVLSQMSFVRNDNPEAVTVSISGNDVGFGDILMKCIHPLKHIGEAIDTASTCYNNYEDRQEIVNTINSQFPRLKSLYRTLRDANGADRRVYVIGYPQVLKVGGDCGVNVQMNDDEVQFAHDLIDYLDSMIKQAADQAGVQYVNTQSAFDGHRLCEAGRGDYAVNGATVDDDPNYSGFHLQFNASFHPNQLGHRLLADTIAAQTGNLRKAMPTPTTDTASITTDPNAAVLQNVPRIGRELRIVRTVGNDLTYLASRTNPISMIIHDTGILPKANSPFSLVLHSEPVNVGAANSDADGNIPINFTVPADLPAGVHTLHVYGEDVFGNPVDFQKVFYVPQSDEDFDGDGVANADDKCPLNAQSGQDTDEDGLDDACDFDNTYTPPVDDPVTIPLQEPANDPKDIRWMDHAVLDISIEAQRQ